MNILFLSTRSPYPLISGHSLRTYHILKGVARSHRVTLVTFVQLQDELREENIAHLRSFCSEVYCYRIPVDMSKARLVTDVVMNLVESEPFVARKYDAPRMRDRIREIVQRERIELVHVDMLPLSVYVDEFRELPKILVNHNVESMRLYRWFRSERNILKKAYLGIQWVKLRSFERSAMRDYDCCVVVSDTDKDLLRSMKCENKVFVIPNGTDTGFFKASGRKSIDNSVVWIGHMDVHTNSDAVLYYWRKIYPLIRELHPNVQMTFVGSAPPTEIARVAGMDHQIEVTNFVEDIRPYLDDASVVVVPIRIGSGTRLKILDAMAMGKAIVSTSVGCEGLDVTGGKDIIIADDPREFAMKTVEVLKNPEVRGRLGRNARLLAHRYDWTLTIEKQEAVYKYALSRGMT